MTLLPLRVDQNKWAAVEYGVVSRTWWMPVIMAASFKYRETIKKNNSIHIWSLCDFLWATKLLSHLLFKAELKSSLILRALSCFSLLHKLFWKYCLYGGTCHPGKSGMIRLLEFSQAPCWPIYFPEIAIRITCWFQPLYQFFLGAALKDTGLFPGYFFI